MIKSTYEGVNLAARMEKDFEPFVKVCEELGIGFYNWAIKGTEFLILVNMEDEDSK